MKNISLIITLFLTIYTSLNAQGGGGERIKALKVTYITNAIDLSSSEAEKFWPIYNEYSNNIKSLRMNMETDIRKLKNVTNLDDLSEKEAEEILKKRSKFEEEILKLKISQTQELTKILSSKKILKLQKAERDFNKKLLSEYGKRRGMGRGKS